MKLIGMLDSPYVRRTAISLHCMNVVFEHHSISVFRQFDEFHAINPVVKAPTFVFDDNEVLMDSTLIIQYAELLAAPEKRLMPVVPEAARQAIQIISVALAACEKAVQLVYEQNLRPLDKQYEPWKARVKMQLLAACEMLETKLQTIDPNIKSQHLTQPIITSAVVWQFIQCLVA
jgi:glutathione S-transferase